MERSSPLAAMQPQALPFGPWGFRLNGAAAMPQCGSDVGFGSSSFNFKDLSMKKPPVTDYFSLKPVRGSSPTSSLAADLSQNFHIDQSPQLPTPRRSLFSSNLFGTFNGRESVITPSLASSSPGPANESMDISPLPHKPPFSRPLQVQVQSATPEPTPTEDTIVSSLDALPESPLELMKPPPVPERRRPTMLRPSLSRAKGHSTYALSTKSAGFDPRPPFRFGNVTSSATASLLSLEECFVESPEQGIFPNPPTSMVASRPRTAYPSSNVQARNMGSPFAGHVRKSSNPGPRPRKQFRRSLSMFEHPGEVLRQQKATQATDCSMPSMMDIDDTPQLALPHTFAQDESIPRISRDTMVEVLNGKYSQCYDQALVIDCRFEYEYKGGHIEGAINFNNKEELATKLFQEAVSPKTLLIFHCEYSAHRAPIAARFIRHEDRATNAHQYPKLSYPEVYILDGGYSAFFKDHTTRCFPQNYVEMNDKDYTNACERGLGRIKQQRTKLSRAQTFAFGQHCHSIDDSPTAGTRGRRCDDVMMGMDITAEQGFDSIRGHARRMASY